MHQCHDDIYIVVKVMSGDGTACHVEIDVLVVTMVILMIELSSYLVTKCVDMSHLTPEPILRIQRHGIGLFGDLVE